MTTFTIEGFAQACKTAMSQADDRQAAASAFLKQTLADNDPQAIIEVLEAAVPEGASVGEMIVHAAPELTMLYARVPPRFQSGIHNHTVFACIGQLQGQEQSTIYEPNGDRLDVTREVTIEPGEVLDLPADVVHHIENPGHEPGLALHLYGGDFGALMDERSLWSSETHEETGFSFEGLVKESIAQMKKSDNQEGLQAVAKAIPAVRPLIDGAR